MQAFSHCDGRIPSLRDLLNRIAKGSAIRSATFFRNTGCHLSGPGDFPAFKSFSFLRTESVVISKLARCCLVKLSFSSGILSRFSSVNTLLKKLFNASAFYAAVDAFDSFVRKLGILHLVFVRDLTYAQNFFGCVFISFARLFSKFIL